MTGRDVIRGEGGSRLVGCAGWMGDERSSEATNRRNLYGAWHAWHMRGALRGSSEQQPSKPLSQRGHAQGKKRRGKAGLSAAAPAVIPLGQRGSRRHHHSSSRQHCSAHTSIHTDVHTGSGHQPYTSLATPPNPPAGHPATLSNWPSHYACLLAALLYSFVGCQPTPARDRCPPHCTHSLATPPHSLASRRRVGHIHLQVLCAAVLKVKCQVHHLILPLVNERVTAVISSPLLHAHRANTCFCAFMQMHAWPYATAKHWPVMGRKSLFEMDRLGFALAKDGLCQRHRISLLRSGFLYKHSLRLLHNWRIAGHVVSAH